MEINECILLLSKASPNSPRASVILAKNKNKTAVYNIL